MTITSNDLISKTQLIQEFNKLVAKMYSNTKWTINSPPTASIIHYNGKSSWYTTEKLVPDGQLSSPAYLGNNALTSSLIDANIIYNALTSFVNSCCRIRKITVQWYFNYDGTYQLRTKDTQKGIFATVTPQVTGSSPPYFTKNPNNTVMIANLHYNKDIVNGQIISIHGIATFFNTLYNGWLHYYNNSEVTFNYFTCYFNCYSDYSSRTRR